MAEADLMIADTLTRADLAEILHGEIGLPRSQCASLVEQVIKHMCEALANGGPMLIEVMLDPRQEFEPRLKSRQLPDGTIVTPALEDMYPFLDSDELAANTIND